jgi:hypothetical protein
MWGITLPNWSLYLFLAVIVTLVALSALARREGPSPAWAEFQRRFNWKWLAPVPWEIRSLMRGAARRRDFPLDLLARCEADYAARFAEEIGRIQH